MVGFNAARTQLAALPVFIRSRLPLRERHAFDCVQY